MHTVPLVRDRLGVLFDAPSDHLATQQGSFRASFATLGGWVDGYREQLADWGFCEGDRVAVAMRNSPQMLAVLLACLRDGLTIVNINYRYSSEEISGVLGTTEADLVIYDAALRPELDDLSYQCAMVVVDDLTPGPEAAPPRMQLEQHGELGRQGRTGPAPALILLTGGTTGTPKGVLYGEAALSSIADSVYVNLRWDAPASESEFRRLIESGAGAEVRQLQMAPMMHGTGMFNALRTLLIGGSVGFMPHQGFDGASALRLIESMQITDVSLVGDAFGRVLADELVTGGGTQHKPARVMSSGAFLSQDVRDVLISAWECVVIDHISASEGGPFATRRLGCPDIGLDDRPFDLSPGAHVVDSGDRVIDDEIGATGWLAASGVQADGYLNDSAASANVWRVIDGERHCVPGDRVKIVGPRRVTLLGRDSSVINTGGEKVQLEEVERALLGIEGIRGAAACGLPDPRLGNRIVALVEWDTAVPALGSEDLRAQLRTSMAGYKLPKSIHAVTELPVGPSGKLRRRDVLALCHQFQLKEEA